MSLMDGDCGRCRELGFDLQNMASKLSKAETALGNAQEKIKRLEGELLKSREDGEKIVGTHLAIVGKADRLRSVLVEAYSWFKERLEEDNRAWADNAYELLNETKTLQILKDPSYPDDASCLLVDMSGVDPSAGEEVYRDCWKGKPPLFVGSLNVLLELYEEPVQVDYTTIGLRVRKVGWKFYEHIITLKNASNKIYICPAMDKAYYNGHPISKIMTDEPNDQITHGKIPRPQYESELPNICDDCESGPDCNDSGCEYRDED